MRVDDDSASGRATPVGAGGSTVGGEGVGGTWTSLVESSVLGTMSDKERKRQEVSSCSVLFTMGFDDDRYCGRNANWDGFADHLGNL